MSKAAFLISGCLLLAGCATAPALPVSTAAECKILMFNAGYIAEHQPPLHLARRTTDVAALVSGRVRVEVPETWSPDADRDTVAALGRARRVAAPEAVACPLDKSPFVAWRPGRAELVLSTPVLSPKGDFAVMEAAVLLPGKRVDYYRFMLSGPPKGSWDFHRITFGSAPLANSR